jgi:hypothetical protein
VDQGGGVGMPISKTCPEPSGNKLSESVFKILFVVCSLKGNGKRLNTKFLKDDEIVFHLAAMSQCEQRSEGHIWNSAHED